MFEPTGINITKEELDHLNKIYKEMLETPVILLYGKYDVRRDAEIRVKDYMDELAKKYHYDPEKYSVRQDTGEVIQLK